MMPVTVMPDWMPDVNDVKQIMEWYTKPHPWEYPIWSGSPVDAPFRCPYDGSIMKVYVWADYAGGYSSPEPAYAGYCLLCNHEVDL